MPFAIKGELIGAGPVMKKLGRMADAVQKRILKKAMRKAAKPMVAQAKAGAAVESGLLKRSITLKLSTNRTTNAVTATIGPRRGMKQAVQVKNAFRQLGKKTVPLRKPRPEDLEVMRNPVRIAHLIELGTSMRRARPFLRPAFDAGKTAFTATLAEEVRKEIEKVASGG